MRKYIQSKGKTSVIIEKKVSQEGGVKKRINRLELIILNLNLHLEMKSQL